MITTKLLMGYLGGSILFVGFIVYLRAIVRGAVTSNRVTWGVWVLVQALFAASYYESVGFVSSIWIPLVYLLGTFLVFIFLLKYGNRGYWSWVEKGSIIGVFLILLLWYIYQSSLTALTLTLFIDILGAIPLVVTVWKNPTADYAPAWYFGFASNTLNLFAIEKWDYANAVYPTYLALMTLVISILLALPRNKHDS